MAIAGLYSMGGRFYRSSMTLIVITKSMLFHSCTLVLKFWCNLKILFGASPNLLNIQTNILINSENIKYWCTVGTYVIETTRYLDSLDLVAPVSGWSILLYLLMTT
jgi:hypothetical protein